MRKKCINSGVIFVRFGVILGHSRAILGHLGHIWATLGHFARSQQKKLRKINGKFKFFPAPLGQWGSLLECMLGWLAILLTPGNP